MSTLLPTRGPPRVGDLDEQKDPDQGEKLMSFREDYEAALREERRIKEALNKLRREHKAAKERAARMREYAKEFEVNLDGDEPPTEGKDKPDKPTETDGEKPSGTDSGASGEPDHSGEAVQS